MAKQAVAKLEEAQVPAPQPVAEADALISMIERAARDPNVDIDKMERLYLMSERTQARASEAAFNAAMATAQAELIPVTKNQTNKQTSSRYADISALAEQAMPTVHKHGFGLIFSEFKSDRPDHIGIACKVTHAAGHSERHEFNIPLDATGLKGNPNKTATHAYGSTTTYGRRYATCCVFNIATKDDDGNAASAKPTEFVTEEQAEAISKKIIEVGADVAKFLEMGGVESIRDIRADQFKPAMDLLEMKKKRAAT